jgi:hypothetical protein
MKTAINKAGWVIATVLALLVVAALAGVARGGPLDPPGPPASTQPQVEPRTPISSLPYTITQSGSYFLTQNLSSSGAGPAITVQASNVTVDLDGFTLNGTQNGWGIFEANGFDHLVVRNGTLAGWLYAIHSSGLSNSRFEELEIRGANIAINAAGNDNVVDNVTVEGNTGNGFWLADRATVSNCRLDHASAPSNQDYGIIAGHQSMLTHCATDGFGYGLNVGDNTQVTDCDVRRGGQRGVKLGTASSVERCLIADYATGIEAHQSDRIVNNLIRSNILFATGILVQAQFLRIEGNQIIGENLNISGTAIYFDSGASGSTVIGNRIHLTSEGVPISQGGNINDVAPLQSAAGATSPTANIVY